MPAPKGSRNNPRGRPPKGRALTEILEKAGGKTLENAAGQKVAAKREVVRMVWELVSTGRAELPNGKALEADTKEWLEAVKWIFAQVDGPPKQAHEHSGPDGGVIPLSIVDQILKDADEAS